MFFTRLKYILIRRIMTLECNSYCRMIFAYENDTILHKLFLKEKSLACLIKQWIEQASNWQRIQSMTCRTCAHIFACSYLYICIRVECIYDFEFYLSEYPVLPWAVTSFGKKEIARRCESNPICKSVNFFRMI